MERRFTLLPGTDSTHQELHLSAPLWGLDTVPSFRIAFEFVGSTAVRHTGNNFITVAPPVDKSRMEELAEELGDLVYELELAAGQPVVFIDRTTSTPS